MHVPRVTRSRATWPVKTVSIERSVFGSNAAGAERVLGDHGVAVHRGAIERRHVDGGNGSVGDHAAVRLADRDPLGSLDRARGVEQKRARLFERNRFADGSDGSHCVASGYDVVSGFSRTYLLNSLTT